MPIRPERAALYPPNWKEIRAAILKRAGNRCEGSPKYPECRVWNYQRHPRTGSRVVLTIAHLTHDETVFDPELLRAWCQSCHNSYDVEHRKATRRARRALGDLFCDA